MSFFTDFYNKVFSFFKPQENTESNVKDVARSRLKLVLMQDRTNLTPKILEQMRGELIDLLSKYVELDKDLLELNFEQEGDQVALMLSIPVIRAKDEKEIEEALKKDALLKDIKLADDEDEGDGLDEAKSENPEEALDENEHNSEVVSQDATNQEIESEESINNETSENIDTKDNDEQLSETADSNENSENVEKKED